MAASSVSMARGHVRRHASLRRRIVAAVGREVDRFTTGAPAADDRTLVVARPRARRSPARSRTGSGGRMIRALLVEDEAPHANGCGGCSRSATWRSPGRRKTASAPMAEIARLTPDVVFLDIQMPGCTGMEVAASLPSPRPHIVFCPAFDEYAVDAFSSERGGLSLSR